MTLHEQPLVRLTEPELDRWGRRIGASIRVPAFLALRGELGAGKSALARAIARGAGVHGRIPSPTFNLVFRYEADRGIAVLHLDLYRIERPDDVWDLGWDTLTDAPNLVIVEWAERAEPLLPVPRWDIVLMAPEDRADLRIVRLRPEGQPPPLPPPAGTS